MRGTNTLALFGKTSFLSGQRVGSWEILFFSCGDLKLNAFDTLTAKPNFFRTKDYALEADHFITSSGFRSGIVHLVFFAWDMYRNFTNAS